MKVVILAGGYGTRLSEETSLRPKPMVEIGDKPILWHVMKTYAHYGLNEFVICCGYMAGSIKAYFNDYFIVNSDITFSLKDDKVRVHNTPREDWVVTVVDTGLDTSTGGRLKRVKNYLNNETFCFTYGDGIGNIDIEALLKHHQSNQAKVTVTAVRPDARFGAINFSRDGRIRGFKEKPVGDGDWINGGFFVVEPEVIEFIEGDSTSWEVDTLPNIAEELPMYAFFHHGFWHPMDTLRDNRYLNNLWNSGNAPWAVWDQEV